MNWACLSGRSYGMKKLLKRQMVATRTMRLRKERFGKRKWSRSLHPIRRSPILFPPPSHPPGTTNRKTKAVKQNQRNNNKKKSKSESVSPTTCPSALIDLTIQTMSPGLRGELILNQIDSVGLGGSNVTIRINHQSSGCQSPVASRQSLIIEQKQEEQQLVGP